MNTIKRYFLLFEMLLIFSPVSVIFAETHIGPGVFNKDEVWDKTGSPYIIDDSIIVPSGITLTIGPGVKVLTNTVKNTYPMIQIDRGSLIIDGKRDDRVTIDGIYGIGVKDGNANITNADIMNMSLLTFSRSIGNISTTTISNCSYALMVRDGVVKVWGSRLTNNYYGIHVSSFSTPSLVMGEGESSYIGGEGNAFDNGVSDPILTIDNSVITNGIYKLFTNTSNKTVYAANNWWGSVNGPQGYGKITGPIILTPWLTSEPIFDPDPSESPECCSSILFLPGLEGSTLYRSESLPLDLGMTENTLWPPNRNDDVRKLFLDTNGSSTDPTIYSGSPIGSVFGLYGIYGKFMGFLDGLTQNGTVNEWKSFAYDWRKPITEVVSGPEKKATTTEYLIKDIENIAARSKTGRVTLIAHSNGGLVAKYLVKALDEIGESDLIDSVISVAVPYLGTPQTIASMLHGDGQSIGLGVIVKQAVARELGLNMSSAYSLLPSAQYFKEVFTPTITFASSSVQGVNNGSYPLNVQSSFDQLAFINDLNNARIQPNLSNTALPIIGNKILSVAADALHSILDPYLWPVTITRWVILGWNANTKESINYKDQLKCKESPSLPSCKTLLSVSASTTLMGDGTVLAKSAAYRAGEIVSADMKTISSQEKSNISHANILESSTTQATIEDMIKNGKKDELFKLPTGMTWGEPDYSKDSSDTELVISTHSPVDLHIYDENGNHTGIIPIPAGLDVEEGLYTFYEARIPGSHFRIWDINEGESDTFISLPDNGKKYSVVVQGTGVGDFTLEVERQKDGAVLDHVEYNGIPVMPITVATTSVMVMPFESLSVSDLVSSSKPLNIDMDGNGSSDLEATSGVDYLTADLDWVEYLEVLKKIVITLAGNTNKVKMITKKIEHLQDSIKKGKAKQIVDSTEKLAIKIGHKEIKDLNEASKQQILDMIDVFIAQWE